MYILILTAVAFCNFLPFSFFICKSTVSVFDVNIFCLKKKFKQNQIVNFMNVEKKRRQSNIGNIMLYFLCQTQNNFKTNERKWENKFYYSLITIYILFFFFNNKHISYSQKLGFLYSFLCVILNKCEIALFLINCAYQKILTVKRSYNLFGLNKWTTSSTCRRKIASLSLFISYDYLYKRN